jgi:fermentation-respiration switch protein FrsA (DUF1100 family)
MNLLKWFLSLAIAGYLGTAALLYILQRDLLYPWPQTKRTSPAAINFPAEEIVLDTSDGEKVIAWHVPAQAGKFVVLYFHGNGDVLATRVPRLRELFTDGTGLIALSYRGYGGSTGRPSETGLLADAAAAYAYAATRYAPERIAVWGFSLGTGPAVAVAAERPVGKLILEAPYTSTADVAAAMLPFLPVHFLMKDQFRSDERIASVTAELMIMHGARDPGIPMKLGERLFSLAREPKRFVRFPDGWHDDLDTHGSIAAVRRFLYEEH